MGLKEKLWDSFKRKFMSKQFSLIIKQFHLQEKLFSMLTQLIVIQLEFLEPLIIRFSQISHLFRDNLTTNISKLSMKVVQLCSKNKKIMMTVMKSRWENKVKLDRKL